MQSSTPAETRGVGRGGVGCCRLQFKSHAHHEKCSTAAVRSSVPLAAPWQTSDRVELLSVYRPAPSLPNTPPPPPPMGTAGPLSEGWGWSPPGSSFWRISLSMPRLGRINQPPGHLGCHDSFGPAPRNNRAHASRRGGGGGGTCWTSCSALIR